MPVCVFMCMDVRSLCPVSICLHTRQLLHRFPIHSNTNTKSSLSWAPSAYMASSPALLHPGSGSGSEVSLFLKNTTHAPISGPLFWLFSLPETLFPQIPLSPSAPSCCPLLQCNLPRQAFPGCSTVQHTSCQRPNSAVVHCLETYCHFVPV